MKCNRSREANRILIFMMRKMCKMSYAYRDIFEGCYETAVQNNHYDEAPEGKDFVVDEAIKILKELNDNEV